MSGLSFSKGKYHVHEARSPAARAALMALRSAAFRAGGDDADGFDPACRHVLIEDESGPAAGFRLLALPDGAALGQSYSARFYDLSPLSDWPGPVLELGRFCTRADLRDPDVLRLGWAAITRIAEATGADLLIGCSSFAGADWEQHRAGLAHLAARALGPEALRPRPKASERVDYPAQLVQAAGDPSALPPLLRSYLGMGGWVSDHAVIDRDLDTCHVFTALQIAAIPEARLRSLRMLARQGGS
ncbi:GNAT family N-acetyltransferase [Thioclava pacifica]|uniref:GNAT family N-acetyltransferase n=1 Tax=Thioclava pacifica TaxID=285109 RepID=UPI000AC9A409|nr:GNAT family N-acyltransferase [Thioclava pacifica]